MKFLTKEEISHVIEGTVFSCDAHDPPFRCDKRDSESIANHFATVEHTVSGRNTCSRCKSREVSFKGLPKPKPNPETGEEPAPMVLCDICKVGFAEELGMPVTDEMKAAAKALREKENKEKGGGTFLK